MELPKYFYFRVNAVNHGTAIELEDASDVDVVEVVRCKDCVYYENFLCGRFSAYGNSVEEPEYDYCSYGERREDDKGRNTTSI